MKIKPLFLQFQRLTDNPVLTHWRKILLFVVLLSLIGIGFSALACGSDPEGSLELRIPPPGPPPTPSLPAYCGVTDCMDRLRATSTSSRGSIDLTTSCDGTSAVCTLTDYYVTYIDNDSSGKGFFVQKKRLGPAIFVYTATTDPTTTNLNADALVTPKTVNVGNKISLEVSKIGHFNSFKQVLADGFRLKENDGLTTYNVIGNLAQTLTAAPTADMESELVIITAASTVTAARTGSATTFSIGSVTGIGGYFAGLSTTDLCDTGTFTIPGTGSGTKGAVIGRFRDNYQVNTYSPDPIEVTSHGCPPPPIGGDKNCASAADDDCIQVATFNIEQYNRNNSGEARTNRIKKIINDNGLDLLCLQEVSSTGVDTLRNSLGSSSWSSHIGDSGGGIRVAYIYKTSLIELNNVSEIFSSDDDWNNLRLPLTAQVTLKSSNKSFKIVGLHLKARGDERSCMRRKTQVEDLNTWLGTQTGKVILTGDFNDRITGNGICEGIDFNGDPYNHNIDTFLPFENNSKFEFVTTSTNGFGSSHSRLTYIKPPYQSVIDHFYVSTDLRTNDLHTIGTSSQIAEVVAHGAYDDEDPASYISDHQPVYIWIKNYLEN